MRTRRNLAFVLLVAALALMAAACGAGEPTRDDAGEITETEDVAPNSLQAGDCFNDPEAGSPTEVTSLEAVPCDEPHDNEVFYVFDLEDGKFPGADEVKEAGLEGCEPEAEAYLGSDPAEAGLTIVPVTPTEQSWDEKDDRTVICALYKSDGTELTGSLRDRRGAANDGGSETTEETEPTEEDESTGEPEATEQSEEPGGTAE